MTASRHKSFPSPTQAVAIVDPSSGGRFLAERAEELGLHVLRLHSGTELDEQQKAFFIQADKGTVALMPGAESGVIAAEKWARQYGLHGNDPATSAIRRNKHRMAEALSIKGIPICRQALHVDLKSAEEWAAHVGYPVVVKPPESSGSDLVRICRNPQEFKQAAQCILTKNTKYNVRSECLLVQEFMSGDEYTVDGVVFEGKLIIFAVGKYKKTLIDGGFVYDRIEFHHIDYPNIDKEILEYAHDVVHALEVMVGAVHIEIMRRMVVRFS
jgi:carbamoylphosphate synthase large subunit